MYIVNACWDVLCLVIVVSASRYIMCNAYYVYKIVFWVETKGLTLEEVDELFGEKRMTTPNIQDVISGKVDAVSEMEESRADILHDMGKSSDGDDDVEKAYYAKHGSNNSVL
jgi:hypothetical protein